MSRDVSRALLLDGDDLCSSAVIRCLADNPYFLKLSRSEGELIVHRDKEDEEKLAVGIDIAIRKGILKGKSEAPPAIPINVVGLTAEQATDEILKRLPGKKGMVVILQGLSGTGKGTTVSKLLKRLSRCVAWSNGNVFRSYAYLCNEMLVAQGKSFVPENLTPELLAAAEKRVTFERCSDGHYRTLLDGKVRVEDIENTVLKTPFISEKVPTVARETQGEVIRFSAGAVKLLSDAGFNVILEGRAQTLDHIPSDNRFELVIPDVAVLGQRRAAQRVMAKALSMLQPIEDNASDEAVTKALVSAVETL